MPNDIIEISRYDIIEIIGRPLLRVVQLTDDTRMAINLLPDCSM